MGVVHTDIVTYEDLVRTREMLFRHGNHERKCCEVAEVVGAIVTSGVGPDFGAANVHV